MELPVSAGTVTFNTQTRQVLMIKVESPSTKKIYWTLPKGQIEEKERSDETAIRETYEETGVKSQIIRKVDDFEIYRMFKNTRFHKRIIMYSAFTNQSKTNPGPEVLDSKFVDFDIALIKLKQHDSDYISSLLKALYYFYKKFPNIYIIM